MTPQPKAHMQVKTARRNLTEYLITAQAHQGALDDLWNGLLGAAPFSGREEEMRRTMDLHEIMFSELHAIQALMFG